MSSSTTGPCRISQRTSKFPRRLGRSSLGGEVYALSDMVDHMTLMRDLFGPLGDSALEVARLKECESLFPRLNDEKMIAAKYAARHFLSSQRALGQGVLGNIYWLPGLDSPAGRLTEVRSAMAPLLRILESGRFCLGSPWPPKGAFPTGGENCA